MHSAPVAVVLAAASVVLARLRRSKRRQTARLFSCGQQTALLQAELARWMGPACPISLRCALPPFNRRQGVQRFLADHALDFDAPVFGPRICRAVMDLFEGPAMRRVSDRLGVRLPSCRLSTFIQRKAAKIRPLVEAARSLAGADNAAAADRLEKFVDGFERLEPGEISSYESWQAFVSERCGLPADWASHLHFEQVLGCFGFDTHVAAALRASPAPDEGVTLEQHSVRWLCKALNGYGPDGCLGDVVNLALAINHPPDQQAHRDSAPLGSTLAEPQIVAALEAINHALQSAERLDALLWLPTHLQHDAESDDTLAWMLLERIAEMCGQPLAVLVQLPVDERLDRAAARFAANPGTAVFRDPDSQNAEAVLRNLEHLAS